jgi:SAM-dependent methyltransferase
MHRVLPTRMLAMDQRTTTEMSGMWGDAFRYDVELAKHAEIDVPFWQRMIRETGARRILELGCGTGRLIKALVEAAETNGPDARYVGIDLSEALLARADERIGEIGLDGRASVVKDDMRALTVEGTFDLAVIAANTLAYLHTPDEQIACLRGIRERLAPDGRLVFDLMTPDLEMIADGSRHIASAVRLEIDSTVPEMGVDRFMRTSADRYDPATQTLHSRIVYELWHTGGRHERYPHDLTWHTYFPAELELLLTAAGMRAVERFGGYAGSAFGAGSGQYLWVCAAA